jgi:Ca2+-binding EF-hand superfamily protein
VYQYSSSYSPYAAFTIPIGLPPHLAQKMMQASAAFRYFDKDRSGNLDKKEFKKAMRHLGYPFSKGQCKQIFWMIDRDHSGFISEREFCEFWVQFGL